MYNYFVCRFIVTRWHVPILRQRMIITHSFMYHFIVARLSLFSARRYLLDLWEYGTSMFL